MSTALRVARVVVQADVRGMHKSEAEPVSSPTAIDRMGGGSVLVTGSVGLIGVSYLANSQWGVAALRPPYAPYRLAPGPPALLAG